MNCASCDIYVYHLWFVFFLWGIAQLQSDRSLSCDHGLDYASLCENNNNNDDFGTTRKKRKGKNQRKAGPFRK